MFPCKKHDSVVSLEHHLGVRDLHGLTFRFLSRTSATGLLLLACIGAQIQVTIRWRPEI